MNMPDLDASDMPDIKTLTREELDKVPYDIIKWRCQIKHCGGSCRSRDYGILPEVWWRGRWWDLRRFYYLCSKHNKRYKIKSDIPLHYFRPMDWPSKVKKG